MINFLKFKKLYFALSAIVIGAGLVSIALWGYKYSIDFAGGSNLEYKLTKKVDTDKVKGILNKNKVEAISVNVNNDMLLLRTKAIDEKKEVALKQDLEKNLGVKITTLRSETVGPTLGKETMVKTLIASLLAIAGILIYMTFSFKSFNFALSAIIALLHDFLVVIGTYALFSHFLGAEVDTLFVTAVLTSMAFSVHDTIIIFDKIREYKREEGQKTTEASVNRALTETLVRSLNNSMTIIFMLLALTLLGGSTIRFFVMTLLVGTLTGAYSSPFIASPVLVWLENIRKKRS